MQETVHIEAENILPVAENFTFLQKEGIRLIEKLAGNVWTDYNSHDPGITLLEAICYALTDLGYRTSWPVKDLLAGEKDIQPEYDILYTARQVLSTGPVTITDYRKMIIDTEGVKNAWIETSSDYEILLYVDTANAANLPELTYMMDNGDYPLRLRGLYKVIVEFEPYVLQQEREKEVMENIQKKLNRHRNLCEDVISVSSVEYVPFTMEAELEVKEGTDIEKIYALVLHVIQELFSPGITFYTIQQMLERGYTIEEIFEGPVLKHGFIDARELETSERYPDIHLSDIIYRIQQIEGVIAVRKCLFPVGSQSPFSEFTEGFPKKTIATDKLYRLDIDHSVINFRRSGDKYRDEGGSGPDRERVKALFNFLQSEKGTWKLKDPQLDLPVLPGENRETGEYYPFQYSLPAAYGLQEGSGEMEDDNAAMSGPRRGALQLKGYLMVFEQIMANYQAQLTGLRKFFSFDPSPKKTYYTQPLNAIRDAQLLFKDYKAYKNENGPQEFESDFLHRRNAVLDHLLARFGEDMSPTSFYSLQTFRSLKNRLHDTTILKKLLQSKSEFLREFIPVSMNRSQGFNYEDRDNTWNTDNVATVKKRIFRLTGIADYTRRLLTCDWIILEERKEANELLRFAVRIVDPETGETLLESNAYPTESEARHIMRHILYNGYDAIAYETDYRPGSCSYKLKLKNPEGGFNLVAAGIFRDKDELDDHFGRLRTVLGNFAKDENFHVIEHILLRPKIDPDPAALQEKGIPTLAVSLLSLKDVPEPLKEADPQRPAFPYRFKTESTRDSSTKEGIVWKLGLLKGKRNQVLTIDQLFRLKSDAHERMIRIKEAGADRKNYQVSTNADGYTMFSIMEKDRKLATTQRSYREAAEMEAEMEQLISYFAFELNLMTQGETDEQALLADRVDPYSFQVSFFLPDWPERFRDPSFRYLLENTIKAEIPSHIFPTIYWLDYKTMKDLEEVYKPWLEEIAVNAIPDTGTLNNLIYVMNEIRKTNQHASQYHQ